MTIWKSERQKEVFLGSLAIAWNVLFVIAFALTAYIIFFFQNCINKKNDCDFTAFLSPYDSLFVTMVGLIIAILFPIVQYFTKKIKKNIEEFERCAELKKQLTGLKGDYIQMKNVKNSHIFTIIDQKNSRLVIISNIADLLRHHYNKELSQDISYICEKCIIFPFSLYESSKEKLEYECNLIIPIIEDVVHQLDETPHNKHN